MNVEKKNKIIEFCKQNEILCLIDYSLKTYNTFRTGGKAELLILPDEISKMLSVQKFITDNGVDSFLIGGGSNLLASDSGYDGMVLKMNYPEKIDILADDKETMIFKVPANARSAYVAKKICDMEYTGLEFLTTIPGSLGGAIVQNAGCYGSEIGDYVQNIGVSENGNYHVINKPFAEFSYRNSIFKRNKKMVVHDGSFRVYKGIKSEIENKVREYKENRIRSQPKNRKNAGSIFKNPPEGKAWSYIQECGLSGYRVGGAEISIEHANFIVNTGDACSNDIYQVICHVQMAVEEKFHIKLEPEIVFLGDFDPTSQKAGVF
jgi:UDP-N-acetylmuramate dehydrogenase